MQVTPSTLPLDPPPVLIQSQIHLVIPQGFPVALNITPVAAQYPQVEQKYNVPTTTAPVPKTSADQVPPAAAQPLPNTHGSTSTPHSSFGTPMCLMPSATSPGKDAGTHVEITTRSGRVVKPPAH